MKIVHVFSVLCCIPSASAYAADFSSPQAPQPQPPIFSWTGLYVGGQAGYAFGEDHAVNPLNGPDGRLSHPDGFVAGGHIGYNFSGIPSIGFGTGGLVLGVEGDVDGSNYQDVYGAYDVTTLKSNIQGSTRGRLGIALNHLLFYATGGAAFASFQDVFHNLDYASFSHTRVGYTVGGGVEYAITHNWSFRAEYRYSDFGSFFEKPNGLAVTRQETMQRVQAGISYKFDTIGPAPVIARY